MTRLDFVEFRTRVFPGTNPDMSIIVRGKHLEINRVPIAETGGVLIMGTTHFRNTSEDGERTTWVIPFDSLDKLMQDGMQIAASFARDNNPYEQVRRVLRWDY